MWACGHVWDLLITLQVSDPLPVQAALERALAAQMHNAVAQPLQDGFRASFQGTLLPAFESACQTMFSQVQLPYETSDLTYPLHKSSLQAVLLLIKSLLLSTPFNLRTMKVLINMAVLYNPCNADFAILVALILSREAATVYGTKVRLSRRGC